MIVVLSFGALTIVDFWNIMDYNLPSLPSFQLILTSERLVEKPSTTKYGLKTNERQEIVMSDDKFTKSFDV